MLSIKNIVICGGGALGHTCGGVLSSHEHTNVSLLTGHPDMWNHDFCVRDINRKLYNGHFSSISNKADELIPDADMVLLCVPAYLVEQTLTDISKFLRKNTIVGAIVGNTGFFVFAHKILPTTTPLFAFQRVPYISRVVNYGKEANLLGYKDELLMAIEGIPDADDFCQIVTNLFLTPTKLLHSFYEVTLSNSNPILHTGRLYTMWKDWGGTPYKKNPLFYHEWTNEASEVEIAMDKEFFTLLNVLGINNGSIKPLLEHYESTDAASLTIKLQSIKAYKDIQSPMRKVDEGWVPDFESRYFTEDFPYGLRFIYDLAHEKKVFCPTIDRVYEWGKQYCNL